VEIQQPAGKSWITDAIIIALVTAGAYLCTLYYEKGFCDYFNIPDYLISLNPSLVLRLSWPVFCLGLLIALVIIFVMMVMEYLSKSRIGIFSTIIFGVSGIFVYFLRNMLSNKNNQALFSIYFWSSLMTLIIVFLMPFITGKNSNEGYWDRLTKNIVITEENGRLDRLINAYFFIVVALFVVLFSVVLGISFYYKEGRDSAMNQEYFLVVPPSPSSEDKLVILRS
jgi:hypothetical protein